MKKLIIAAVMLISMSTQMLAGPIITFSIEFGHRDANKNCIERGLCDITIGVSRGMTGTINDNTGVLEITIIKSASQLSIYQTQFVNGLFEVPVAYTLSKEICAKLGVEKYTIKAGKYKVVETNNQYKIIFQ